MVKLSIVIPFYKTYDLTVKLLDVLTPQLTDEVEVYLVDDGCNEIRLDEYKDKIKIIHLEKNIGGASAMNVAIKKVIGQYIAIIDSDDMVDKEYVSTLIDAIDNHEEEIIYFDWKDMNTGDVVHHPHNYAPWKAIYKKEKMPLFREGWIYSYDVPFQEDLYKLRLSEYFIDKILYYYNSNREGSLTLAKERLRKKEMITLEVTETFYLKDFDQLEDIQRKGRDVRGQLFVGDIFKCSKEMCEYLLGSNPLHKTVARLVEVEPEERAKEVEEKPIAPKKKVNDAIEKKPKKKSKK